MKEERGRDNQTSEAFSSNTSGDLLTLYRGVALLTVDEKDTKDEKMGFLL